MRDRRRVAGMLAGLGSALALLLAVGYVFSADPVESVLTWQGGSATFNSQTNLVTLTAVEKITYTGEQTAVMTCSRAVIEMGEKNEAAKVTMSGPVKVDMQTKGGTPKVIAAKCVKTATYVRETDSITLLGNAECTVRQLQPGASVRELHFSGDRMTLQLKTGDFAIERTGERPAEGTFTFPPKEKEEPGEEAPQKEQPE